MIVPASPATLRVKRHRQKGLKRVEVEVPDRQIADRIRRFAAESRSTSGRDVSATPTVGREPGNCIPLEPEAIVRAFAVALSECRDPKLLERARRMTQTLSDAARRFNSVAIDR
jgi:hypothetical protein